LSQAQLPQQQAQHRRGQLQVTSISTSGRLSGTSPYSKGKSPMRCHSSTPLLFQPHHHQQSLRRPRRRPNNTSGVLYMPCKLSWTNGGSRRMHPKGRASDTDRNAGKGRNTSCQMTPRSATLSRCPRSRSSSREPVAPSLQRQHPTSIRWRLRF
jgi:hypothetical protein